MSFCTILCKYTLASMQDEHVVRATVQLTPDGPVKEFSASIHENNRSLRDCVNDIRTELLDYYRENIQGNPQGVCILSV